jgi:hypothetical protein
MSFHFKNLVKKPYLLVFLNGFMLASLCYFQMERSYENELYFAIKQSINNRMDSDDTQDSLIVKTMHTCHYLMSDRATVFGHEDMGTGFKMNYLHPTTVDLMTARGACGAYSVVLARMLKTANFDVRIAQMKANGIFAAHNVVEVQANKGWVVLDPTFDVYFTKPDHSLAAFEDVSRDWNYYRKQTPSTYDTAYRYADVRYTNWTKVPLLSRSMKGILNLCMGRAAADKVSIRTWFMNIYTVYFFVCILMYIPVFILTFRRFIRSSFSFAASERHIQFESQTR